MNLSLENRVLLSLIAKTSFGKDIDFLENDEKLEDINWDIIYTESIHQAIVLFASNAISPYTHLISKELLGKWLALSSKTYTKNSIVLNGQQKVVNFLNNNNYKYLILKGPVSASYYENPDMRMLGDIDILIEKDKTDEIVEKLQNEFSLVKHTDIEHYCHVSMHNKNMFVEAHFEIPGIPDGNKGEYTKDFIKNILLDTKEIELESFKFIVPNDIHHGIVILLHMLHHMTGEGLGLRHLCDWGAFVNKTSGMAFWDTEMVPYLKNMGLYTYTSIMTSVCKKYFNINTPQGLFIADDDICEEVMFDILQSGNLGKKDEQYTKSALLISQSSNGKENKSNFTILFEKLDSAVKSHWPWLRKWKILLPLAYIYFALKYYVKVLSGKRPTISFLIPEANRRREIYNKLKIFEDTNNE